MSKNAKYLFTFIALVLFCKLSAEESEWQLDKDGIQKTIEQFAAAWNKHDPKAIAALWTENGDLLTASGKLGTDRQAVEKIFLESLNGRMVNSKIEESIQYVRFLRCRQAFVDTQFELRGAFNAQKQPANPILGHAIYLMEKNENKWMIVSSRRYVLEGQVTEIK